MVRCDGPRNHSKIAGKILRNEISQSTHKKLAFHINLFRLSAPTLRNTFGRELKNLAPSFKNGPPTMYSYSILKMQDFFSI
jgi:hypothetical protein